MADLGFTVLAVLVALRIVGFFLAQIAIPLIQALLALAVVAILCQLLSTWAEQDLRQALKSPLGK